MVVNQIPFACPSADVHWCVERFKLERAEEKPRLVFGFPFVASLRERGAQH